MCRSDTSHAAAAARVPHTDRGLYRPGDTVHLRGLARTMKLGEGAAPAAAARSGSPCAIRAARRSCREDALPVALRRLLAGRAAAGGGAARRLPRRGHPAGRGRAVRRALLRRGVPRAATFEVKVPAAARELDRGRRAASSPPRRATCTARPCAAGGSSGASRAAASASLPGSPGFRLRGRPHVRRVLSARREASRSWREETADAGQEGRGEAVSAVDTKPSRSAATCWSPPRCRTRPTRRSPPTSPIAAHRARRLLRASIAAALRRRRASAPVRELVAVDPEGKRVAASATFDGCASATGAAPGRRGATAAATAARRRRPTC